MAGKTFRLPPLPPKLVIPAAKVDFQSGGSGSDVFIQTSGLEALAETLRSMPRYARDAAGYEMAEIAHEIIEDARENYVPYRFGNLKDSGNADEYDPRQGTEITEIAMWFGAPMTAMAKDQAMVLSRSGEDVHLADPSLYALDQHENMLYGHHPPPDQTGPKYLEKPFVKVQNQMASRIAKAVGISWGISVPEGDIE